MSVLFASTLFGSLLVLLTYEKRKNDVAHALPFLGILCTTQ